jgi:aryl-alcohol dehydrogenase-like predicted oxidoreductase
MGSTDMDVSVLGLGGAEIGSEGIPQSQVDALLNSAFDTGLNVIDTAACYGDSEEKVGRSIGHRRSELYLFTKCGHTAGFEGHDWEADIIRRTIERSLRRLRTDRVDLVMLHSCETDILEAGEAITALQAARDKGQTRFIGYSGDGDTAYKAVSSGLFDVLQTSVSIADQQALDRVIPLAAEKNMGVIAKRPIANAVWQAVSEEEMIEYRRPYFRRLKQLDYPFLTADGVTVMDHALRFTISCPGVHTAIVGTAKPEHWQQNAAVAAKGCLSEKDFLSIRERWRDTADPDWDSLT